LALAVLVEPLNLEQMELALYLIRYMQLVVEVVVALLTPTTQKMAGQVVAGRLEVLRPRVEMVLQVKVITEAQTVLARVMVLVVAVGLVR
jgi:hypothetical protein